MLLPIGLWRRAPCYFPRIIINSSPQPVVHEIKKLADLNTSSEMWYKNVVKNTSNGSDLGKSVGCYVDVRDVALANVLALEKDAAGGERILASAGKSSRNKGLTDV